MKPIQLFIFFIFAFCVGACKDREHQNTTENSGVHQPPTTAKASDNTNHRFGEAVVAALNLPRNSHTDGAVSDMESSDKTSGLQVRFALQDGFNPESVVTDVASFSARILRQCPHIVAMVNHGSIVRIAATIKGNSVYGTEDGMDDCVLRVLKAYRMQHELPASCALVFQLLKSEDFGENP